MPIIKSAKKRVRVAKKATVRNSKTKRTLKSALKLFTRKTSTTTQSGAQSALDKAVKKGVIHKNKAARLKKQMAAAAKAAGTKNAKIPAKSKTTATTAAAKKATPKKAIAKKKAE